MIVPFFPENMSPQETICMKCQCLFSVISKMSSAEIITQHAKRQDGDKQRQRYKQACFTREHSFSR